MAPMSTSTREEMSKLIRDKNTSTAYTTNVDRDQHQRDHLICVPLEKRAGTPSSCA